jgi:hypothetical protein
MAAVNIVIKAINSTKAAFQEVGRQADTLNKRMAKIGQVFKGLFIGGVAVRFGKSLLQASTYGKELEESGARVKEAWNGVTTEIGDAFARIVLALEGPIKRVGGFLDTVIKRAQWGAAYITGLVTTGSSEKARKIADEVIADLEAEKKAREDATDAATNDHAKTVNYENEKMRLLKQLMDARTRARRQLMEDAELLDDLMAEKKNQLDRLNELYANPDLSQEEKDILELKAQIEFENLNAEIERVQDRMKKALKEAQGEIDPEKPRRKGVRTIKFNRDHRAGLGQGMLDGLTDSSKPGSMAARSKERMDKLNKLDPSWRSADYLKRINTALDSLTNTLEGA